MTTTLYYFSGTGNSLNIARQLSEKLEDCTLIPIAKAIKEESPVASGEKVGFVFPLYYYGLPKIIYDFANKLDISGVNYLFAIVTRAGDIDGVPFLQLERIFRTKSKNLSAGFFVLMPDNFIVSSIVISEDQMNALFAKTQNKVEEICNVVEKSEKNLDIELPEGKINRIERGNLRFHKNANSGDSPFFTDDNCNSCGTCEEVCPVDNIELVDGKPQWQHLCQQCLACINFCPESSIQYGKNTAGKKRYHHPKITSKDIVNQK